MDLATGHIQPGNKTALLLVDLSLGFTSPESPLGGEFDAVISANKTLLSWFREQRLPIYFSTVVYDDEQQASVFRQRLPDLNILQRNSHWIDIDPRLAKQDDEIIIEKHCPSAFFGSNLAEQLHANEVDTVVITGLTTSGCVRATAVDGLQNNFLVFVVKEACGDRNENAALANFHDINAKYGRVINLAEFGALFN